MTAIVIDTNVLLVANKDHDAVSPACVIACIQRLLQIKESGRVVLDDGRRILREYQNNFQTTRQPGVGDAFIKWLAQNHANEVRVNQVRIDDDGTGMFAQFPNAELQARFDPSDRKFVAAASAHPDRPPIVQAADSKWLGWSEELHACGVRIQFPCPADISRFFQGKFPGVPVPPMP